MNTKNNQRFQDSERKMQDALLRLLKSGSTQEITVQDICKESEVNRTTFYAHYSDIRELTEKSEIQLREAFMLEFQRDKSEQPWQIFFLYSVKGYMNFYRLYFQYHYKEKAQNGPAQIWLSSIQVQLDHYRQAFYQAGIEAILYQWVESGCKDSPETIQTIINQRLPENIL